MAIQTLHDPGEDNQVPSKYDGGVYAMIPDAICKGIGDEFAIQYQANSLDVYFNTGSEAIIGGSFFKVESTESLTLQANTTTYICANIDLSHASGETGSFVGRTSSNMRSDNINGSGTSRDLLLYVVTTGSSGVTSVQDKRVIRGNATSISGIGITMDSSNLNFAEGVNNFKFRKLTQAQYEALGTKDSNTLYFTTDN